MLPSATSDAGATIGSDGQVYVIGGFDHDAGWLSTVQVYSPTHGTWAEGTALPSPACCSGTVTVPGGQIFVVNGGVSAGSQVSIYGPSISLVLPAGSPVATSALTGTGFAPASNVSVYWGPSAGGTLLATGTADWSGAVVQPISFTVPATATPGTYVVTAVDDQSLYPVTSTFVVPSTNTALPALSTTSNCLPCQVNAEQASHDRAELAGVRW